MKATQADVTLRKALDEISGDIAVTVADAAAKSGLPLREAERGLHALVAEYRGHLRVTEDGDLIFTFPTRFRKPWETQARARALLAKVGGALSGIARFVVRAWVAIVLVGYALLFVALFIALTFSRSGEDRDRGGFSFLGVIFRLVAEALFWTYHPWSPFRADVDVAPRRAWGTRDRRSEVPFYERVDRFFFGPKPAPEDPLARERAVLSEIRAQKGRVGLGDVMRVTGATRAEVDPLMSRLMLDFEGEVEVSDDGGIFYRFKDLRKTALPGAERRPKPVWQEHVEAPKLTGNTPGSNLVIGGINLFNLLASGWVLLNGLTVERIFWIFSHAKGEPMPAPGLPIALGVVPFVFSLLLFLLPLGRLLLRPLREKKAGRERGRRAVLKAVLEGAQQGGVSDRELRGRYAMAAGFEPDEKELTRELVALGGDVDLERAGEGVRYRFADLELEHKALEAEREAASEQEARVGKVVFSSEN